MTPDLPDGHLGPTGATDHVCRSFLDVDPTDYAGQLEKIRGFVVDVLLERHVVIPLPPGRVPKSVLPAGRVYVYDPHGGL